jgi:hypothetical protein
MNNFVAQGSRRGCEYNAPPGLLKCCLRGFAFRLFPADRLALRIEYDYLAEVQFADSRFYLREVADED